MTDKPELPIVRRLLKFDDERKAEHWAMNEAADLITALVEALQPFAQDANRYDPPENDDDDLLWSSAGGTRIGDLRRARDAIKRAEGTSLTKGAKND